MLFEETYLRTLLIAYAGVVGLVLGSFINCWAWRSMHGESVLKGRSHCTTCGHVLGPLDLVPVLSWLFSGGRCRYCGAPVSMRYPLTELICGGSLAAIVSVYGSTVEALELCLLACTLLFLSLTDIDDFIIPNGAIITALVIRFVYLGYCMATGKMSAGDLGYYILSALAVGCALLVTVLIADHVLGRESMGGGDLKLYAVAALYVGWQQMLFLIVLSCVLGLLSTVFFNSRAGKSKDGKSQPFPFGPSIALAFLVTLLCGGPVMDWYLGLFL